MGLLGGEVWLEKQTPPQKNLLTLTPRRKIPQSETEDKNLTDLLTNVFLKCIELYFEILNDKRAWWKGQPDVDREKVSCRRRRRRPSTILTFSTGWRRPDWRFLGWRRTDWAFLRVDVDQTELFYWSTSTILTFSWSTSELQLLSLSLAWSRKPHSGLNYSYLALALA